MKQMSKLLACGLFLLVICTVCIGTFYQGHAQIVPVFKGTLAAAKELGTQNLETVFKENLWEKSVFIECFGGIRRALGLHLTDDQKFYKDRDGVVHLSRESVPYEGLLESTGYLAKHLAERDIPFLICQTAERGMYEDTYSSLFDGVSTDYIEPLRRVAEEFDTLYLDYSEEFRNVGFEKTDIFFKTDLHYTTQAEFVILSSVIEQLEEKAGLSFANRDVALDISQYTIESYPLLGNLGATTGQIYTGTDVFQYYLPTFPTELVLSNPAQSLVKTGSFENVCLNGCRNTPNLAPRVYRVIDYLQYPSPLYNISNNLVDANDILIIGCSMPLRTAAYLSLLCHSVTVLDPRTYGNTDYLKNALGNDFDAVILFASANLLNGIGGYDADIQSFRAVQQENGTFHLYVNVRNSGTTAWKYADNIRLHLWVDDVDIALRAELPPEGLIAPEDTCTFVFEGLDNAIVQRNISAQMLKEGVFYFGAGKPVEGLEISTINMLDAKIVSHTAPLLVNCEEKYSFSITVKNTGTSAWSEKEQIRLCIWQDGVDWGYRLNLPDGVIVEPGKEYEFVLNNFVPPSSSSTELMFWMAQEGITYFGEQEKVDILIEG